MPNLSFCILALTSIVLFLDLSIVWASPTISRKPLNLKWRGGAAKRTKSLARRVPGPRPDNTVVVDGPDQFCLIVPRTSHTDIGNSEHPGGTTTYCSASSRFDTSLQGEFSRNFWTNVDHVVGSGVNGERYAQLTGCIDPSTLDRINSDDDGGQYDSSGGSFGNGNPQGSACLGYNHYIELIEPSAPRACVRCCDDPDDCPTHDDRDGCPNVIPGNYFDCA